MRLFRLAPVFAAVCLFAQPPKPGRDPNQPVDEEYTRKIREYTTESFFNSPLTGYLPASKTVPTPKAVLGDISGAPGILPYSADVYRYMRMLEKATPRVKVFSIGQTEEGREMIAVAVANEKLIASLDENLLVSGLLDGGPELAQHPAVIDSPLGQGHVVMFSNNPFWRAETKGSYFLVFNAILNFDHLDAGRMVALK